MQQLDNEQEGRAEATYSGAALAVSRKRPASDPPRSGQGTRIDEARRFVPGAYDVQFVLQMDPVYKSIWPILRHPAGLGVVLFMIVIAVVVLGPSTEAHFIYTDF